MKLQRTFSFPPALFGIMPLLNVLFLVVVFFAMGSRFLLQPGVAVNLPVTSFALGPQRNGHVVSLTGGPAASIYFRDQKLAFTDLKKRLLEVKEPDRSLIIKADRSTPHDLVVQVMNLGLRTGFSVLIASDIEQP